MLTTAPHAVVAPSRWCWLVVQRSNATGEISNCAALQANFSSSEHIASSRTSTPVPRSHARTRERLQPHQTHIAMSFLVNPSSPSSRAGDAWFCAGPASSYPNVDDSTRVAERRLCRAKLMPGCRIFHVPREDSSQAVEVAIDDWKDPAHGDAKDQVMVFQYNGKFIAINHVRSSSTCSLTGP